MSTATEAQTAFHQAILEGIPDELPAATPYDTSVSHAPKRKDILSTIEKKLAIKNALRYFPKKHHSVLAKEFAQELADYGRIYMYRFRPDYKMYARPIEEYPAKCQQAAAIMVMIQNNLDYGRGTAPPRTDHLWRKWRCFSKLGAVQNYHEIPGRNDR